MGVSSDPVFCVLDCPSKAQCFSNENLLETNSPTDLHTVGELFFPQKACSSLHKTHFPDLWRKCNIDNCQYLCYFGVYMLAAANVFCWRLFSYGLQLGVANYPRG